MLSVGIASSAQPVEVVCIDKINIPSSILACTPTISPDGEFAVVSDYASGALWRVSLTDGCTTMLTPEGNGNGVLISADGKNVVFRRNNSDKHRLRYTSLRCIDLSTGAETEIVPPSRHLNAGATISGVGVSTVCGEKMKTHSFAGAKAVPAPVVSINYGHLEYTADSRTITLDPQGRGSYLWPALSPDGTKVAYYLAGRGCFVCDTDGGNLRPMGLLRAAKWLDDNTLVGMNDVDDGRFVTSSSIVAVRLDGERSTLTGTDVIAMYPSPSADAGKIVFATPQGELYLITLKQTAP